MRKELIVGLCISALLVSLSGCAGGQPTVKKANSVTINKMSETEQVVAVENSPKLIRYIDNQSEKVQLAAIESSPNAHYVKKIAKYIKNPSEKVQLALIEKYPNAIKYIKNPTKKVQLRAKELNKNQ